MVSGQDIDLRLGIKPTVSLGSMWWRRGSKDKIYRILGKIVCLCGRRCQLEVTFKFKVTL